MNPAADQHLASSIMRPTTCLGVQPLSFPILMKMTSNDCCFLENKYITQKEFLVCSFALVDDLHLNFLNWTVGEREEIERKVEEAAVDMKYEIQKKH